MEKEMKNIDIEKIHLIQEEWKIEPTKVGQQIGSVNEGGVADLGPGYIFKVKTKGKWYTVRCSKSIKTVIQEGLAVLHNGGYISLK